VFDVAHSKHILGPEADARTKIPSAPSTAKESIRRQAQVS
jgi:hypothetical protein